MCSQSYHGGRDGGVLEGSSSDGGGRSKVEMVVDVAVATVWLFGRRAQR